MLDPITQSHLKVTTAFAIISAVASLTVLIPWAYSSLLRNRMFKMMKITPYIAICNLFSATVYSLRFLNMENKLICKTQAFIATVFNLGSIFWATNLTHFLYRIIVLNHRKIDVEWYHHGICWGFPFLLAVFPLFFDIQLGQWPVPSHMEGDALQSMRILTLACQFEPTPTSPAYIYMFGSLFAFIGYAMWIYICLFIMIFEFVVIIFTASRLSRGDIRLEVRKFTLYPISLVFSEVNKIISPILSTLKS